MANRPVGYGFTAETTAKIAQDYDVENEQEARSWIEAVLGEELVPGADQNKPLGSDEMQRVLKDGIILTRLLGTIEGKERTYHISDSIFKQMENISRFLLGAEEYGVNRGDLFRSVDLMDNENMAAVINAIHALGRKARLNGYSGPTLGPQEAEEELPHRN